MAEPVVIGNEQNKFIKDTNTKALTLYNTTFEPNNTYTAMQENAANYQVPVGKKFVVLRIKIYGSNTAFGNVHLYEHSSASTSGGSSKFYTQNATDANAKFNMIDVPNAYIEFATGNYINFFFSEARAICIIYGVELDA
jgi:hypothetical protein